MFPSILIVDDEPSILTSLSGLLSDEGFEVFTALNGYEALKSIEKTSPDLVLLDIWMPGIDGIETLKEIKRTSPYIPVIIITGHGTIETAVRATKLGAFDFVEKPLSIDKVILAINNALNFRRLEEENRYLRKKTIAKHSLTGNSAAILTLRRQIMAAAPTDNRVLITGENGTGKELVARTLHQFSPKAEGPFVDINCAALSEDQMEKELFGAERGYLDESAAKNRGKFELAVEGTIFLDEIGDMPLGTQAKILRMLEEKKFQRLGSSRVICVDVRIMAATNKDLTEEIAAGRFREDLFFRLNEVPIHVPALRERMEDLPLLVETFLSDCAKNNHRSKSKKMTPEALDLLSMYHWPGNVRELKNLVGRLDIMTDADAIDADMIPKPYNPRSDVPKQKQDLDMFFITDIKKARKAFEREYLKRQLDRFDNDLDKCAKALGLARAYLQKRFRDLG